MRVRLKTNINTQNVPGQTVCTQTHKCTWVQSVHGHITCTSLFDCTQTHKMSMDMQIVGFMGTKMHMDTKYKWIHSTQL